MNDHPDCGCIGVHPGQSHEEYMDQYERKRNTQMVERAAELAKSEKFADRALAVALAHKAIEYEIDRLQRKAVWMPAESQEGKEQCHAGRDGDCNWSECPQLRDGEPLATGRHCPYDQEGEE